MSIRKKYDERCDRCFMKLDLCLCDQIPRIEIATKVVIIVSKREFLVPTNTGRLASLALSNSVTLIRGDLERPYNLADHLPIGHRPMLLYPAPEAAVLTPEFMKDFGKPCTLIVPDGNWRQANKMRRRDPIMESLPIVKVAPGDVTKYKVRRESQQEGLATIEAIARALGVIEGSDVKNKLESLLEVMVTRTLASRGVRFG
jgi:DTW domain-containing protein YfiP